MKILKKVSLVTIVALCVSIIAFSACKKEKDTTPVGTKSGNEMCNCYSKKTEQAMVSCVYDWYVKYQDYFNVDFENFENFEDIEDFEDFNSLFKDKTFQQDFISALLKCDAIWEMVDDD